MPSRQQLSNTDALIESLEQLIAKKRQLKQGACRSCSPEKGVCSFRKEWESMRLGELLPSKTAQKAKEFFGHGTPIVNYMDVFQHPAILGSMLAGRVFLTNQELSTFDVRMGDVSSHGRRRLLMRLGLRRSFSMTSVRPYSAASCYVLARRTISCATSLSDTASRLAMCASR